ncbi:hypothetical protein LSAT2_030939 [Lamellibrachia satsuma]|nr:hypothetical protein LSAT2_030939 [Lamellibrachia satsuma]
MRRGRLYLVGSVETYGEPSSFRERAAQFLLHWTFVVSLVTRDLTLLGAHSFGSVHLVHLMLNEYILLVIETQTTNMKCCHLERTVQKCSNNKDTYLKMTSSSYDKNMVDLSPQGFGYRGDSAPLGHPSDYDHDHCHC